VTHALHFVSDVDYIYTIENGQIAEHGTYPDLMAQQKQFYRLLSEHGGGEREQTQGDTEDDDAPKKPVAVKRHKMKAGAPEGLITQEKRTTGGVSWKGKWKFGIFFSRPLLRVVLQFIVPT
jgi:ATP-binding cassette, subfamily C (CFTR/MRP), member 1